MALTGGMATDADVVEAPPACPSRPVAGGSWPAAGSPLSRWWRRVTSSRLRDRSRVLRDHESATRSIRFQGRKLRMWLPPVGNVMTADSDDLGGCHAPVGRAGVGVARRGDREQALGEISAGMAVSLALATVENTPKCNYSLVSKTNK